MPSSAGILTQRFSVCGNWGHCNMIRNELEESYAALYKRLLMTDFLDGLEGEGSPHAGAASKGSPHAGAATKGSPHTGAATKGSPHTGAAASSGQPNMDYKAILEAIKEHEDALRGQIDTKDWHDKWNRWMKQGRFHKKQKPGLVADIIITIGPHVKDGILMMPVLRFCTTAEKPVNFDMFVEFVFLFNFI